MVRELARVLGVDVAIPDSAENVPNLASDLAAGDALLARSTELFAPHLPEPPVAEVERLALDAAEWIASGIRKLAE